MSSGLALGAMMGLHLVLASASGTHTAAPDSLAALVVEERPWSTVVTVSLAVPHLDTEDLEGLEGTGWILARALADRARAELSELEGEVQVNVQRGRTDFTLTATPQGWGRAYEVLSRTVFEDEIGAAVVERVRDRLLVQMRFEEGAPVRAFQNEVYRVLYGPGHPWSRPLQGRSESVQRIRPQDVQALHRLRFRKEQAYAAVLGPVIDADVRSLVTSARPVDASSVLEAVAQVVTQRTRAGRDANADELAGPWEMGERLAVPREVTSTWIAVGFPVAPVVSRTEQEFLAHAVLESLSSKPPDPGLYSVQGVLEEGQRGTVFVIRAAVVPEVAARWEARILGAIRLLETRRESDPFFRLQRRRFRSAVLLDAAQPELEGRRLIGDLLRFGTVRDMEQEVWRLSPDSLLRAAAALGEPRILVFGPDLTDRSDDGR